MPCGVPLDMGDMGDMGDEYEVQNGNAPAGPSPAGACAIKPDSQLSHP